jgi:hypothetical protein
MYQNIGCHSCAERGSGSVVVVVVAVGFQEALPIFQLVDSSWVSTVAPNVAREG